jgi:DNA-binding GntR family transcriptional regulator
MLQSEALVVLVPHVGATVATISRDSIVDVFTMLEGLETVGTRLAAERATPEDQARLIMLVHEMEDMIKHERYEEWADLNTRFHLSIARIPGLAMLEEMTARVLTCWDRVRRYYFKDVLVYRLEQAQREHHEILAAITSCNLPALEALVRRHNQGALKSYIEYVNSNHPDEWP